ncbi:hypothetical protein H8O82_000058 [Escherichia coli]|nr:hypothetical protein [Escherichia coli]
MNKSQKQAIEQVTAAFDISRGELLLSLHQWYVPEVRGELIRYYRAILDDIFNNGDLFHYAKLYLAFLDDEVECARGMETDLDGAIHWVENAPREWIHRKLNRDIIHAVDYCNKDIAQHLSEIEGVHSNWKQGVYKHFKTNGGNHEN